MRKRILSLMLALLVIASAWPFLFQLNLSFRRDKFIFAGVVFIFLCVNPCKKLFDVIYI